MKHYNHTFIMNSFLSLSVLIIPWLIKVRPTALLYTFGITYQYNKRDLTLVPICSINFKLFKYHEIIYLLE